MIIFLFLTILFILRETRNIRQESEGSFVVFEKRVAEIFLNEESLYLSDDVGSALNEVCDLVNGIGLALGGHVDELNLTVLVANEEAYGRYGKSCSTAAAKVLGFYVNVVLGCVLLGSALPSPVSSLPHGKP